jgi:hypothetical protein
LDSTTTPVAAGWGVFDGVLLGCESVWVAVSRVDRYERFGVVDGRGWDNVVSSVIIF